MSVMRPDLPVRQGYYVTPSSQLQNITEKSVHFNTGQNKMAAARQRESLCVSHGLTNDPGENNCFLNSAVQIFWHLDVFRRSFRRLQRHLCSGKGCIFCGIKMLFGQFQESVDAALAPDMLRRALATTFEDQQRFQLGCMDDAAECFEHILLRIHYHTQPKPETQANSCSDPLCIPHRKFAMNLTETFSCNDCHATSDLLIFSQMVHYVHAGILCQKTADMKQRGVTSLTGLFGKLIRKANETGDHRVCQNCGSHNALLKRTLTNRPDIITLGLVWESDKPKSHTVAQVLHAIDTNMCLCHLYHSVNDAEWASSAVHHLVGMIGFYGRHYVSFFYHSRYQTWMYFDDASVKVIGPDWGEVVIRCVKGRIQPLLLFYANPEFALIGEEAEPARSSETTFGDVTLPRKNDTCLLKTGQQPTCAVMKSISIQDGFSKPQPPRPPVRTVSRPSVTHSHRAVPLQAVHKKFDNDQPSLVKVPSTTTPTQRYVLGRQNSRASITSDSVASMESFDSFEQLRAGLSGRDSAKDETDSGYPTPSSTSNSSIEMPVVKREPHYRVPATTVATRTQCLQMLLRADDLMATGLLKEEKSEFSGAVKLFEQAAGLLQSCAEPLRACPQFSESIATKQMDCYKKLQTLYGKIANHRSGSSNSSQHTSCNSLGQRTHPQTTLVPHTNSATHTSAHSTDSLSLLLLKQETDSLKRMHKSRRKATSRNMGSLQTNRSMPDLSQVGDEKLTNYIPPSSNMSTFQALPTDSVTVRSAVREAMLNELSQRILPRTLPRDEDDFDEFDLPPPPPELLLPPEFLTPNFRDTNTAEKQPCSLCGNKVVTTPTVYCPDCHFYISRFSQH